MSRQAQELIESGQCVELRVVEQACDQGDVATLRTLFKPDVKLSTLKRELRPHLAAIAFLRLCRAPPDAAHHVPPPLPQGLEDQHVKSLSPHLRQREYLTHFHVEPPPPSSLPRFLHPPALADLYLHEPPAVSLPQNSLLPGPPLDRRPSSGGPPSSRSASSPESRTAASRASSVYSAGSSRGAGPRAPASSRRSSSVGSPGKLPRAKARGGSMYPAQRHVLEIRAVENAHRSARRAAEVEAEAEAASHRSRNLTALKFLHQHYLSGLITLVSEGWFLALKTGFAEACEWLVETFSIDVNAPIYDPDTTNFQDGDEDTWNTVLPLDLALASRELCAVLLRRPGLHLRVRLPTFVRYDLASAVQEQEMLTPLQRLYVEGSLDAFQMLLRWAVDASADLDFSGVWRLLFCQCHAEGSAWAAISGGTEGGVRREMDLEVAFARELIDQGGPAAVTLMDINSKDPSTGVSYFFSNVWRGRDPLMAFLIDSLPTLCVTETDPNGATMLHKVCYLGAYETLEALLLRPEIDVNERDHGGRTAAEVLALRIAGTSLPQYAMRETWGRGGDRSLNTAQRLDKCLELLRACGGRKAKESIVKFKLENGKTVKLKRSDCMRASEVLQEYLKRTEGMPTELLWLDGVTEEVWRYLGPILERQPVPRLDLDDAEDGILLALLAIAEHYLFVDLQSWLANTLIVWFRQNHTTDRVDRILGQAPDELNRLFAPRCDGKLMPAKVREMYEAGDSARAVALITQMDVLRRFDPEELMQTSWTLQAHPPRAWTRQKAVVMFDVDGTCSLVDDVLVPSRDSAIGKRLETRISDRNNQRMRYRVSPNTFKTGEGVACDFRVEIYGAGLEGLTFVPAKRRGGDWGLVFKSQSSRESQAYASAFDDDVAFSMEPLI